MLHSQLAHFSCIQSLFCILNFFKVKFQLLKISQILDSAFLYQCGSAVWFRASDKIQSWFTRCCFRYFNNIGQITLFTGFPSLFILFLMNRCIFWVSDVAFVRNTRNLSCNLFVVVFVHSRLFDDVLAVRSMTMLFKLLLSLEIGHNTREWMWGVSRRNRQEVLSIDNLTASLQDTEGSLSTITLNVPKEVFLYALNKVKTALNSHYGRPPWLLFSPLHLVFRRRPCRRAQK